MEKTIRGHFEDTNQAKNTRDALINAGIPNELIHVDKEDRMIRVILPAVEDKEVLEIFDRHGVTH